MNKIPHFEDGTKRIKCKDEKEYIKKSTNWIFHNDINSETKAIIDNFVKYNNKNLIIDELSKEFLKGYLSPEGTISGTRIKHLPNGKKLARGGYSIFAKNLRFNDNGKFEWDICFENESGLKTYLYSCDKVALEKEHKSKIVDKFITCYPTIIERLTKDLKQKKETKYLALYTLIKTLIRVGNLEYYNHLGHKGLTTLQKKDIKINGNNVTFEFIGKDGIPQKIKKEFEPFYIKILSDLLKTKTENSFVFTDKKGVPLHSNTFSQILYEYTKKHFYPHIIRSHYADTQCINFLKNHKTSTKKEIENKLLNIALNLGHKKYNKKTKQFEPSYKVTIENYIRPKLVEKIKKLQEKSLS